VAGEGCVNLSDCPLQTTCDEPGFEHRSASVREALGGELIGCTVYEFDHGTQLWPYHLHWANEEWLVVVSGAPTLRTPDGERALRAGDVVGFPQGEGGAHALYNRSAEPVRIAIFSTRLQGSVDYPDSAKIGAGPPHDRLYLRRADAVDYWDGEA
jgi:uncharacterized cupin superfamily protein